MEKKRTIIHWVICVGLVCLIWGVYFVEVRKVNELTELKKIFNLAEEIDYSLLNYISEVRKENNEFVLSGVGVSSDSRKVSHVILQPINGSDKETIIVDCKKDGEESFFEQYGYGRAFEARISEKEIEQESCYEILLVFSDDKSISERQMIKVATNRYLYEERVYKNNPEQVMVPRLMGEKSQEIIEKGNLYSFDSQNNVWIYHYENKLYCIAQKDEVKYSDKILSVPVSVYTFHGELVPEERKEKYYQKGFDSLEVFIGEEHQVVGEDGGYYFVSIDLPKYPITYIRTGIYEYGENDWISKSTFQLDDVIK